MKLFIYLLKDKELGCFCQPFYDDHDTDYQAIALKRHLVKEPLEKILFYKHKDLYCVGTFDDETGVITSLAPELVFDCDSILDQKGVKQDG